tara:strand:- start:4508 stop:5101 length:594 start_codon:yes stop_codon:yes gene_type:complete
MNMKTTRQLVMAILLISAAMLSVASIAAAQTEKLQLKRTFGLRGSGESHVQMRAIIAPVRRSAKSLSTAKIAVTPVLTVVSKDKVGFVCTLGPRITDALLRAWYEQPLTLDYLFRPGESTERAYRISKNASQQAEDARLLAEINKVLNEELVSEILVLKGARKMGGGAMSKLPFASVLGCAELEQADPEPDEKKPAH